MGEVSAGDRRRNYRWGLLPVSVLRCFIDRSCRLLPHTNAVFVCLSWWLRSLRIPLITDRFRTATRRATISSPPPTPAPPPPLCTDRQLGFSQTFLSSISYWYSHLFCGHLQIQNIVTAHATQFWPEQVPAQALLAEALPLLQGVGQVAPERLRQEEGRDPAQAGEAAHYYQRQDPVNGPLHNPSYIHTVRLLKSETFYRDVIQGGIVVRSVGFPT